MKFRKDINGLRAIALIAILIFHFYESWIPGGFAALDVFFVISGFLMTGIIFRGLEDNSFSLSKFYIARANRIIPTLSALCFVMLVFGWFFLIPFDYKTLGEHIGSSMIFLSNFNYLRQFGYFDTAANEKWILHTWSLSAEWQFYTLYPLFLIAIKRLFSLKAIKPTLIIGSIIGFVFSTIYSYEFPTSAYYLLPTRIWEMLLGGVAYLHPFNLKERHKRLFEWLGLGLIFSSYAFIDKTIPWPGYLSILPVSGAFLIIQSKRNNSIFTNNIILQSLGSWSYSIYLWHWPLVVIIYYYSLDRLYTYLAIPTSILIGFISYRYIESIKLEKEFKGSLSYLKCKPIYMVVLIALLGRIIFVFDGINSSSRFGASTEKAKFINKYKEDLSNLYDAYWMKCSSSINWKNKKDFSSDPSCFQKSGNGGVFLWGDSHAEALSLGIRQILKPLSIPFYQKTSADCRPSLGPTLRLSDIKREACNHSNESAINNIKILKPKVVIIAQADEHHETNWSEIYTKLSDYGVKNILIIGPIQQWLPSLPKVMIKTKNWNNDDSFINDNSMVKSIFSTDQQMRNFNFPPGIEYISLVSELCDIRDTRYFCRTKLDNGELLQLDFTHLSINGSLFVSTSILSKRLISIINNK